VLRCLPMAPPRRKGDPPRRPVIFCPDQTPLRPPGAPLSSPREGPASLSPPPSAPLARVTIDHLASRRENGRFARHFCHAFRRDLPARIPIHRPRGLPSAAQLGPR
jgi:hypothetical protein